MPTNKSKLSFIISGVNQASLDGDTSVDDDTFFYSLLYKS